MLGKFITSFIEILFWATHHHVNASTSNNTQNGNTRERCCASVPVQECWPGSSGGALHNWCALFHYFWPSFSSHLTSWLYDLYPVRVFAVFVARKSFKWLSNISKLYNFFMQTTCAEAAHCTVRTAHSYNKWLWSPGALVVGASFAYTSCGDV